jgi:uncharacterized protein DUF2188
MARRVMVVSPNRRAGGWDSHPQSGSSGPISHHDTKPPAINAARRAAKAADLGQVKIQKQNGRLQTEYTYGQDPPRRKG